MINVENIIGKMMGVIVNKKAIKDMIIDLVFEKHCEMKEVSYHQDALVCDDLIKMKEEIKIKLDILFND